MKKFFLLCISSLLVILSSLIIWLIGMEGIILPIWLFRDLCIPIVHFSMVSYFIKKNYFKNGRIIFAVLLYFVTIVANIVILGSVEKIGRLILFYSIFDVLWSTICGLVIIGYSSINRAKISRTIAGGIVTAGALAALTVNALLTWILSPVLGATFAIDDVEILLLPLSVTLLSLFSYLLGTTLTKQNIVLKLLAWFLGVLASVFVSLWLIGSPHILPLADYTLTIIWIAVSLIIFVCSFVGMTLRKKKWWFASSNHGNFENGKRSCREIVD